MQLNKMIRFASVWCCFLSSWAIATPNNSFGSLPKYQIPKGSYQIDYYYPTSESLIFTGRLGKFLRMSGNPYNHSIYTNSTNPFDGVDFTGGYNINYLTSNEEDLYEPEKKTIGSHWRTEAGESKTFIKIDNTVGRLDDFYLAIKVEVMPDVIRKSLPPEISSSFDEVEEHIDTLNEYDWIYTILHELAHTKKNYANTDGLSELLLSSSQVRAQQIKESIADLSSIIYISKNELIPHRKLISLIKGIILYRHSELIWNDKPRYQNPHLGDIEHNTISTLTKSIAMLKLNPNVYKSINDDDIMDMASGIVLNIAISNPASFLSPETLKTRISDNTFFQNPSVYGATYSINSN